MTTTTHGRHQRPEPPVGFWQEVKDAVAPRTIVLVVGVLLLQLGFVLSYIGAFHQPAPYEVKVAVVAPEQVSSNLVTQLNSLSGTPLLVSAADSEANAREQLTSGDISAVLVVDPAGTQDRVLTASGGGVAVDTAVQQVLTAAEASQQRTLAVEDVVPLQPGDGRGLTGFYLVIGWIVGGYLIAALLGVAKGARPANPRRALIRLVAVLPYAILSGLGGALVVGPVLGAMTGHFVALWWLGALLVFAAAAFTMALQVLFGVLGIGITVLIFVVLGNPSAGGAYSPELLPRFWRTIGGWIPNGAGTAAVRRIVYFDSVGVLGNIVVIALWAVVGVVVTLAASALMHRRQTDAPAAQRRSTSRDPKSPDPTRRSTIRTANEQGRPSVPPTERGTVSS